jgi:hypothetical protein
VVGGPDLYEFIVRRERRELAGAAERVVAALDDQGRAARAEQFPWAARAEQRIGQREHGECAEFRRRAAGYL